MILNINVTMALFFQKYEPITEIRSRDCLSFEGFFNYMTDKENNVYSDDDSTNDDSYMSFPLSCYYIASSHNTYLTGHQLKGESSIDLYSQVRFKFEIF